jgi:hypothetical protein
MLVLIFRCVEGPNVNLYGFRGCEDWAKNEYCVVKDKIQILIEEEVCYFLLANMYSISDRLFDFPLDLADVSF